MTILICILVLLLLYVQFLQTKRTPECEISAHVEFHGFGVTGPALEFRVTRNLTSSELPSIGDILSFSNGTKQGKTLVDPSERSILSTVRIVRRTFSVSGKVTFLNLTSAPLSDQRRQSDLDDSPFIFSIRDYEDFRRIETEWKALGWNYWGPYGIHTEADFTGQINLLLADQKRKPAPVG